MILGLKFVIELVRMLPALYSGVINHGTFV